MRTPITAVRASSEILHDDIEMPEEIRKQFLQNIISESDRLNRLIDKILDLEKFESGQQSLSIAKYLVIDTINNAINPLRQLILNKGIIVEIKGEKLLFATFDADRIFQVITNIIGNAIKFCPDQNGIIDIKYLQVDKSLEINIADNGFGILSGDFENIFDKFYQSDNQNLKKPIGSGLGLAISKQIIERHSGKIWAKNNIFGGATFIVHIPI